MGRTEVEVIATDEAGNEGRSRFVVTVRNEKPVASELALAALEDFPLVVGLSGRDAEGAELSYTITVEPRLGTLGGVAPRLVYTPFTNASGVDRFRYRVNDGNLDSDEAEVTLAIAEVNDAPVALGQAVSTPEDTGVPITLEGADAEEGELTFRVTEPPRHGVLTGTPPNLAYTPDPNFNGTDRFRFQVDDGRDESAEAEVVLTVQPVNDVPIAVPQSLTLTEDAPRDIVLSGTDVEGAALTFSVVTPPTRGRLSGSGRAWTYIPDTNVFGADAFTFVANDGETNSVEVQVTLGITPVNDAPEAIAQQLGTTEDVPKTLVLSAKDPEGDPITYVITVSPVLGTLSGTPPNLVYHPATNASGTDRFRFKAQDALTDSAETTVEIQISPVDDPPVALAQTVETPEDTEVRIRLQGADVEGGPLTHSIVSQPQKGTLKGAGQDWVYLPKTNATGTDTFTFRVRDGAVESAPAVVTVVVTPVNDPPVAGAQALVMSEDGVRAITLTASDADGDKLAFAVTEGPNHGVLSGTPPSLTYRPATNWSGVDRFRFKAVDAGSESVDATVVITVGPVNDAPSAQSQTVSLKEDTSVTFDLVAADAEGAPIRYILASLPTKGLLSGTPPTLTYLPDEDATGTDSFTFRVNDGSLDSVKATVTLNIQGVNDAPVARAQSVAVTEDVRKAITLQGSDVDGDRLQYTVTVPPTLGTLSGTPPNLVYIPRTNAFGTDRFSFRVQDASLASPEAEVSITIDPVNDAPVFQESLVRQVLVGDALAFRVAVVDPEAPQEQRLSFDLVKGPQGFQVATDGWVTWRPLSSQGPGNYSAEIRVADNGRPSLGSTKTLQFQVVARNEAPVLAVPVDRMIPASTLFALTLSAQDPDLPRQTLTYRLASGPSGMTVSGAGQLSWRTPAATQPALPQTVRIEVTDGRATNSGSFRLTVVSPASVLPVTQVSAVSSTHLVLSVLGLSGTSYAVEAQDGLGAPWSAVPGIQPVRGAGMDKPVSVSLPLEAAGSRFYRIKRP